MSNKKSNQGRTPGSKLKSRKFWMVAAGAALTVANDGLGLGLPAETILGVVGMISAYVVGQGYVDGQSARAGK